MKMLKERLVLAPCIIGLKGNCCKNCLMGPCRIFKPEDKGVCGANRDLIIARNILRFAAAGAAAHCGHAYHMLKFLKKNYPFNYIEKKAPSYLCKLWQKLEIMPRIKFEHFKDISEALHTSTMGANADYTKILGWAMKIGIVDGYYGLYLATELEDKAYGKPKIKKGFLDLGVIDEKKVNIAVHGHEPIIAEALAKEASKNKNINLIGICCTGASILARHGIPLAANFVLQEDVIATGAIDALVIDIQCIMPSIADLCECFHTKLITTNPFCRFENALHLQAANKKEATKVAKEIIKIAISNKKNRKQVSIKKEKKQAVVGFNEENLPLNEWAEKIKNKEIKGIIAAIGCVNPRVRENWADFYKELSKDYIILATGCQAFELGKAGLLDGKRFFHLGSCVNNSRVAEVFKKIAEKSKKQITDLPFLVSCPMPMTEKAIAIGFFFASIGVDVHFGYPFMLTEDSKIAGFLATLLKKDFKSKIFLETSPSKLKEKIKKHALTWVIGK